jgi:hypothetical protein
VNTVMRQRGITLVICLVLLTVLTVVVVSAARFGTLNVRLAVSSQVQSESAAAAQLGVDTVLRAALNGTNLSALNGSAENLSTGGASYAVRVERPRCALTQDVPMSALNPDKPKDRLCYSSDDREAQFSGTAAVGRPSACKDQMWDISASVGDAPTGAAVTVLQGAALRVGAEVDCPLP